MKPLQWPEPRAGEHDFHSHDHAWWSGVESRFRGGRECSKRFRCARCWRWFPGEACGRVPA